MKFNINDYIRVKLTSYGEEILKMEHEYYDSMRPVDKQKPFKLQLTSDGWYQAQAWSIFQTFGNHIRMGSKTPFETEIEIEE